MARTSKDLPLDLSARHALTAGLIARLKCPTEKSKAFLRDSEVLGLRVRVTRNDVKSFVFETKTKNGDFFSKTIGSVAAWSIEQARSEARKLSVAIDQGLDPREIERQNLEEVSRLKKQEKLNNTVAAYAWQAYIEERAPKWGHHHLHDHLRLSAQQGTKRKSTYVPPLYPLLQLPLQSLNHQLIEAWAMEEGKKRPTTARLAWRLLKAFLSWCSEHEHYSAIVSKNNPAKTNKTREALGKPEAKKDALLKEQLPAWFSAVDAINNTTISVYLQCLLLLGCRPGELRILCWKDLDLTWNTITLKDKVGSSRTIPLTPHVRRQVLSLPKINSYVFASDNSQTYTISEPNHAHSKACRSAGIPDLTLHGLRRSFKSLSEWLNLPLGVIAQIQGHKPSATVEKHYTVRPLDLLRVHHELFEKWILENANLNQDKKIPIN